MTLVEIAANMKQTAAAKRGVPIRRQLRGGLHLIMLETLTTRRLSLVRADVRPSPKEIEIVRRDFDIPQTARQEPTQQVVRGQMFYIVRLIWPRRGQMRLLVDDGDRVVVAVE